MIAKYNNDVLLKVKLDETCVQFKTSSRMAGTRRRFLCDAESLRNWVESYTDRPFYDQDCGNILKIVYNRHSYTFRIEVWWVFGNDRFTGFHQNMILSGDEFMKAIRSTEWRKFLCKENDGVKPPVYIWTESAQRNLRLIGAMHNHVRRAFLKAWARNMLNWPNTKITLYADSAYNCRDFYFRTDDGICGGLICHKGKTRNGYDKYEYASHT